MKHVLTLVTVSLLVMGSTAHGLRSPDFYQRDDSSSQILEAIPPLVPKENQSKPNLFPLSLVLSDFEDRIPDDFHIPLGLHLRTAFWLNIYTRFSSHYRLIHDARFPWIVYKVINVSDLKSRKLRGWQKVRILNSRAREAKAEIEKTLKSLSQKKNFAQLTSEERELYRKLKKLPGERQSVFSSAANNVRNQLGQSDYFRAGLINSQRYLPAMEKIFASYSLPGELTRLPLVESSFNETAVSKVGASGVWQIMPTIGKQFSQVNRLTDERNSPIKATHIAAKLLKENYQRFRSWPLAVSSYNHGPGGIAMGTRRVKSKRLRDLILKYKGRAFGFASKNFYAEFLAALYAEKYKDKFFGDLPKPKALTYEVLPASTTAGHTLKEIAVLSQLELDDLLEFNLDLKRAVKKSRKLPDQYDMILPAKNAKILKSNLSFLKKKNYSL